MKITNTKNWSFKSFYCRRCTSCYTLNVYLWNVTLLMPYQCMFDSCNKRLWIIQRLIYFCQFLITSWPSADTFQGSEWNIYRWRDWRILHFSRICHHLPSASCRVEITGCPQKSASILITLPFLRGKWAFFCGHPVESIVSIAGEIVSHVEE